ncbi:MULTISPECIES: type II toxin-antitoxin system RelE/ParE family toxin [unclassified Burkholderia]|uniref:type II toxin-antitoxin system RelE/ParE family toxin n=1 Tax=unclassified Burkholderia TaxID=2613784 RepID=UPI0014247F53|nr:MULTISPECIES: type II toxin-antitoxin system RelE/ParE family toxin [unclassified Burkholderia]NIE87133.1 type II toxin-antitoxin system RelE/ParE family toxin [Burkholderia sp. Tr-860]NIF65825.1 type II toxin-antitoxin system RelE/ParE family toxin [Burkholderia sp. Cy-647]NIF92919.1 type II toxin-antitoxin system RelE/ParE family toxin [Burkholderia sp. Cy-637]NIF97810.1 type II toxin-antitoxin system RelE/ParE family toxin [Burkholderia sp. Ax-1720]
MSESVAIVLTVHFFVSEAGNEPVRVWLRTLDETDRRSIGADIKTVQFGWPLGMPLVRKLGGNLYEVRIWLAGRIARILFTVAGQQMVLLHGFIKKSRSTPRDDLALAVERMKRVHKAAK